MKSIYFIFFFLLMNKAVAIEKSASEYVVILHGIARTSSHMSSLREYLQKKYDVISIDYPSTYYTLEELVDLIHNELLKKITEKKLVHFVGYSMGGLLVRAIVDKYPPRQLGRVVQLAPPNSGSEVADFFKDIWLYEKIYGPAGQQLTTTSDLSNLFKIKKINYDLGIIAGNRTIDPISSIIIPGVDDGKVSVESTKLKGMKDHIVVSASHTFFPTNKIIHQQTEYFLKHGMFKR